MTARPKAILGYLVGWLLVVCFVVLFSIIFSFVGTIICAALAGMMMGAARLAWWQSFVLSLVFPAVITSVFRVTKAELPLTQVLFIAALCYGIFWVIYLALRALTPQEEASRPRAAQGVSARRSQRTVPRAEHAEPAEVTLDALQGTWLARNSKPSCLHGQRALEISHDTLLLTLTDDQGHVSRFARAQFQVNSISTRTLSDRQSSCLDSEFQVCI